MIYNVCNRVDSVERCVTMEHCLFSIDRNKGPSIRSLTDKFRKGPAFCFFCTDDGCPLIKSNKIHYFTFTIFHPL
jgi:hypothetical protein